MTSELTQVELGFIQWLARRLVAGAGADAQSTDQALTLVMARQMAQAMYELEACLLAAARRVSEEARSAAACVGFKCVPSFAWWVGGLRPTPAAKK